MKRSKITLMTLVCAVVYDIDYGSYSVNTGFSSAINSAGNRILSLQMQLVTTHGWLSACFTASILSETFEIRTLRQAESIPLKEVSFYQGANSSLRKAFWCPQGVHI
jgi:hypothetical protein